MKKKTTLEVNTAIKTAFTKFENYTISAEMAMPAYWYHEQRSKTYVTIALDKVSQGKVIQEPELLRKRSIRSCRADYFVQINRRKYLIEVKQIWTPISRLKNHAKFLDLTFTKIRAQLKGIKKSHWKQDTQVGLCIVPIFCKNKFSAIDDADTNIKDLIKVMKSHEYVISSEYIHSKHFHDNPTKTTRGEEFYHGYFLIWVK